MNIRELLKRDFGIEVRISAGTGHRDDPFVVENCGAEDAALTQVQLLRGIARELGELWRIIEWKLCEVDSTTEVMRIHTTRFTPTQIETETRGIYFDTRLVVGAPCLLHPLTSWRGPPGSPVLPYELGWLHFNEAVNNAPFAETFDQTIFYSGDGAKASVYVYDRSASNAGGTRDEELKHASALLLNPELRDPWPVIEMGPFAMKFFLLGNDMTAVGIAVCGPYFVKVRLTYFDDLKMRELMKFTLSELGTCVHSASTVKH
ncbi:hypothetical protein [Rhodoferax sp.]|uniref:hypothetical protein n=1 Tax=Rhodoferax sp. TaxID=50421 RepID=UPI00262BAA27|nr:hypothetical protein [Rhodoferax sp.]MDD3936164.1 hypothetical protein [Rhodoferax sp.]